MKMIVFLMVGAVLWTVSGCLPQGGAVNAAEREELATKVAALESEVAALKAKLGEAEEAKAAAGKALEEAKSAAEQQVGEAAKRAAAELAAARKEATGLRDKIRQMEAEHAAEVADLQKQIKAIALKVPAGGGGNVPGPEGNRQPPAGGGIERHVGGGQ